MTAQHQMKLRKIHTLINLMKLVGLIVSSFYNFL